MSSSLDALAAAGLPTAPVSGPTDARSNLDTLLTTFESTLRP
jgi:hypothetical protein